MVAVQSQILTRTLAAIAPPLSRAPRPSGNEPPANAAAPGPAENPDTLSLSPEARRRAAEGEPAQQQPPDPSAPRGEDGEPLSDEEQRSLRDMKTRDAEVRAHEQAHVAAAGPYFRGGPTYETERGPDGKEYAVGGSVSIDSSPVKGDPEATIAKMQQVRRAALAPKDPSATDRSVAAKASAQEAKARQQLAEEQSKESGAAGGANEQPNRDGLGIDTGDTPAAGYTATGRVAALEASRFIDIAA